MQAEKVENQGLTFHADHTCSYDIVNIFLGSRYCMMKT